MWYGIGIKLIKDEVERGVELKGGCFLLIGGDHPIVFKRGVTDDVVCEFPMS